MLSQNIFASILPVDELSPNHIRIIENKGQWDNEVLYRADIPGGVLFITHRGFTYNLIDNSAYFEAFHERKTGTVIKSHNFNVNLVNGILDNHIKSLKSPEYYNYFIGNDPSKWKSDCRAYGKLTFTEVWPGIDMEVIALRKRIKINFVVHPIANPSDIRMHYEGIDKLGIENGNLIISTSIGNLAETDPVSFQQFKGRQTKIPTNFIIRGDTVGFGTSLYNPSTDLIIDPNIIFGTFTGSVADNWGYTATNDTSGNAYSGGTVHDNAYFSKVTGSFQTTWAGGFSTPFPGFARDCGIVKYSSDGSQLLFATYLGGSNNEGPHSMVCDKAGNLYVMGATWSTDFPVTATAFDKTHNGKADIYVCKISNDGKNLLGSTLIGGAENDGFNGKNDAVPNNEKYDPTNNTPLAYNYGDYFRGEIVLDGSNNVYVATSTFSSTADGFPLSNANQTTFGGNEDAVIIRLNNSLSSLVFCTYLGGSGYDAAYGINVDNFGFVYVCGGTYSTTGFGPSTGNFKHHGNVDAFVARFSTFGSLTKLICYGTEKYDQAYLIQFDNNYNVYITGQTEGNLPSKNSPVSVDNAKQFITSFNNGLDSVIASVNFGKSGSSYPELSPSAFLVDICNRVYFSGWGGIINFGDFNNNLGFTDNLYTTSDAYMKSSDGSDFYLIVFSPGFNKIEYATYIGGLTSRDHVDGGTSRFDKNGVVYQSACAGCGGINDFPTTTGAYSQTNNSNNCNNALLKMNLFIPGLAPVIKDTTTSTKSISDTILYVYPNDTLNFSFDIRDYYGFTLTTNAYGDVLTQTPNAGQLTKIVMSQSWHRFRLKWNAMCFNIGDTVRLNINSINNNCPNPLSSIATIRIFVKPLPPPAPPYPECVQHITDTIVDLKWQNENIPAKNIVAYHVYRREENGPYSLFANINNAANTFTDTSAYDNLKINYCYYVTSEDLCGGISVGSRIICSKYKEDTASTIGFRIHNDTILYMAAFDTITFQDTVYDSDNADSVYVELNGSLLKSPRTNIIDNSSNLGLSTYGFKYTPNCDDITKDDTITLDVFSYDNQCPSPRTIHRKVRIVVFSPPLINPPSLRCIRKVNEDEVAIRWLNIPVNKYFSHYIILRKNPDGSINKIAEIKSDTIQNINFPAPSNETVNYCYAICPVSVCGTIGDTSPFQCSVHPDSDYPLTVYPYTVTVENNKNIRIYWKKSQDPRLLGYNLYRHILNSTFEDLMARNTSDTTFLDENANVHKYSYCYVIKQTNDCGLETKIPDDGACSILLEGNSKPFTHSLNWNKYIYWPAGVTGQNIYRKEPELSESVIAFIADNKEEYTDENLNIDNGEYFYTIEAVEGSSGFGYTSKSNTIELIQKPIVYAPNAYTPNGDGLNDKWTPRPVFVKTYDLKIFDRWGRLIMHTNDKHEGFSEDSGVTSQPTDAYVYLITYTGWDGTTHVAKGNFTLLR